MSRRSRSVVILAAVAVLAIGGNASVRSFSWPASDVQATQAPVILAAARLVPRWDGDAADDRNLAK